MNIVKYLRKKGFLINPLFFILISYLPANAQIDRLFISKDEYGLTEMVLCYNVIYDPSLSRLSEYLDLADDKRLNIEILESTPAEKLCEIINKINEYLEKKTAGKHCSFSLQFVLVKGEQKDYVYPPPPPLIQDSISRIEIYEEQ